MCGGYRSLSSTLLCFGAGVGSSGCPSIFSGFSSSSAESNHLVLILRELFSAVSQSFEAIQSRTCSNRKSVFSARDLHLDPEIEGRVHGSISFDLKFA